MGLLRLTRPANVITAVSDILAGIAISGYLLHTNGNAYLWQPVLMLILSTMGLYAGGVVFNDVFDAGLDAVERPERPIPSGIVSKTAAMLWGTLLLVAGIAAAAKVHTGINVLPAALATAIVVCALIYDKWCKHHLLPDVYNGLMQGLEFTARHEHYSHCRSKLVVFGFGSCYLYRGNNNSEQGRSAWRQ